MNSSRHYKALEEGIRRARLIREDLRKTLAKDEPQKIRGLNRAYIDTIRELIRQGEAYLDINDNFTQGMKVAITIENCKAFLSTLPKLNDEEEQ